MVSLADLAYAAGIIDGEGTIVIEKSHDRKSSQHIRYRMHTTVLIREKALCDWFQLRFGGKVYLHKNADPIKGHSQTWLWRVGSFEAVKFLEQVKPYLKLKQLQADNAMNFQLNIGNQTTKPLSDEQLAVREAQKILMGKLNRKGIKTRS